MIESAEIQNFRALRNVTLRNLSLVNVVVGDNGSGKTALLEALFLANGFNAEMALRLRQWRGVDAPGAAGSPQEIYDGIFLDIFNGFNRAVVPTINLRGNANDSSSLRIYYDATVPTVLPFDEVGKSSPVSSYTPITFEWKDGSGKENKVTPRLSGGGLQFQPSFQFAREVAFLAARAPFPTTQNARWFSEFSKWGREKRFISTVQTQFKYVESLSVEVDAGNPVIFVKLPWLERKMPIYLASDGLNKLVTLLLHIAHCEKRTLFVDELENGFHYTRHQQLWEQLLSSAQEYETQLFFGTHSWEFLTAGMPLMKDQHQNFSMIQVMQENGVSTAITIPGENAAAAIEEGIELRR